MAEIYLAEDLFRGETVAIKIIPVDSAEEVALIESEANIARSLDHESIIKTYFASTIEVESTHYFYYVMEYVRGGNFREFLSARTDIISIVQAVDFMKQIANALTFAHIKIIHRDLKPENVLVQHQDRLKLCDFGLSKYVDAKTRTHSFKGAGTFPYSSPEVWLGGENTIRMDVYSAGIIFFELLTLQRPFIGPREIDYRNQHLYQPLPRLLGSRKDVPVKLAEMILKMTDKRVDLRYASMQEVQKVLESVLGQLLHSSLGNPIDPLLVLAHSRIERKRQSELATLRVEDEKEHRRKALQHSFDSLLDLFEARSKSMNDELERNQIRIQRGPNYLHLYFMEESVSISLFSAHRLEQYIAAQKKNSIENQNRTYGRVLFNQTELKLERQRVICAGRALDLPRISVVSIGWYFCKKEYHHGNRQATSSGYS